MVRDSRDVVMCWLHSVMVVMEHYSLSMMFTLRSRLIYQSKKRGILENDIILGQFAEQRLEALDRPTLEAYDKVVLL